MKRVLWFFSTVSVLLIMLFYARQTHPGSSAYESLNYAFLYNLRTGVRIQISDDMVPYIGMVALYSLGVLYVLNGTLALQRDFLTFVISRLNGRNEFVLWSVRSVLVSSLRFTVALGSAILLCMMLLFHTGVEIRFGQFWIMIINIFLTFAWIAHMTIYVNIKYERFFATILGLTLVVIVLVVPMTVNSVALVSLSDLRAMEWGSILDIALYIATVGFLKSRFRTIDI